MRVDGVTVRAAGDHRLPPGLRRIEYCSAVDGRTDWALAWPPPASQRDAWVVVVHGHGSDGDQLYTRADIRDHWLRSYRSHGLGVLTPNLRGNAWMGPAAAGDLAVLLDIVRHEFGARRFVFCSGSMGGTSNLIYAVLRPEDVSGVIARGAATDLGSYHGWCRRTDTGVLREIADAIEAAYGGPPDRVPGVYASHSALVHAERLRMPVFLAHGVLDRTIPVSQARRLVGLLSTKPDLTYVEVPDGGHDSPLCLQTSPSPLEWLLRACGITADR